jgi:phosphoglycolate phosphatase
MVKLITLDWEGTLVDFQWDLAGAEAAVKRLLAEHGLPHETFAHLDYAALYNFAARGPRHATPGSLLSQIDEIYDRCDLDAASRWTAAAGLRQTLDGLRGCKLALVSNIGRKAVGGLLARLGLADSFGLILTRNDVRFLKPSPEGLRRAMAWAGAAAGETVHVGDSFSDLFAARAAGVKCAIVLGGQDAAEALRREKPDLVLEKLAELPAALREHF